MELKSLSPNAIGRAFDKAKHYRLLNDPENAESICLDILEVDPNHQEAIVVLILSLADQFDGGSHRVKRARSYLESLKDEFHRAYYAGIISERNARVFLKSSKPGTDAAAYDRFREAMEQYEKAESLTDDQNDDAILRWNACARTIKSRKLEPRQDDNFVAYGDG